jgi:hypothetical protein
VPDYSGSYKGNYIAIHSNQQNVQEPRQSDRLLFLLQLLIQIIR